MDVTSLRTALARRVAARLPREPTPPRHEGMRDGERVPHEQTL